MSLLNEIIPHIALPIDRKRMKQDLTTAFIGAVLVIPQGITFAYLAGLPPIYGLYTAVFTTLLASVFGSSPMISGPNTAVSILIGVSILPLTGRGSPLYIDFVFMLTFMAGCFQMLFWLLRGGAIFQYVSSAAISGISAGAGVLIMIASLDGMFGISAFKPSFAFEKLYIYATEATEIINPYAAFISFTTIAIAALSKRKFPRLYIVIAMVCGFLVGNMINLIWSQFDTEIEFLGYMDITAIQVSSPIMASDYIMVIVTLIPAAIAIAFVGLIQSLVIARDLKLKTYPEISLNKEVFAQAVSNIVGSFLSCFASSGSFNRTEVNRNLGATSTTPGILIGPIVFLILLLLHNLLAFLPMPVMTGILFYVGLQMIKIKEIRFYAKVSSELIVYLVTLLTIAFFGLVWGVLVAILLSLTIFLVNIAKLNITITTTARGSELSVQGSLFYASVSQLSTAMQNCTESAVFIDLSKVNYMDIAAIEFFKIEINKLDKQGRVLRIENANPMQQRLLANIC